MSFFGKSGPSPEELARSNIIKSRITETLRQAIHSLQKSHIDSEEPIRSEDSANTVCSVVEAVFLFGLKTATKSYWPVVSKVTHKDVVAQLRHLSQVTTEVGLCRAWVRLALNDGILESYLDALMSDAKIVRNHYERYSFLRDPEQMDIFKSYLQGLQCFIFSLAYNASVLNLWTSTPLILAGLQKAQNQDFPAAKVLPAPTPQSDESNTQKTQRKTKQSVSSVAVARESPIISDEAIVASPSIPYESSQLTASDIDQIRDLTKQSRVGTDETSSTSASQFSHPDFSDTRAIQELMPSLARDLEELKFQSILADTTPLRTENGPQQLGGADSADRVTARIPEVPTSSAVAKSPKNESQHSPQHIPKVIQAAEGNSRIPLASSEGSNKNIKDLFPQLAQEPNYSKINSESPKQRVTTCEESKTSGSHSTPIRKSASVPQFLAKKSPPLQPELSRARADSVEVASEALTSPESGVSDTDAAAMDTEEDDVKPSDDGSEECIHGNSLDRSSGWSSNFYPDEILPDVKLKQELDENSEEKILASIPQSFDSLLHSYAPPSQQQEVSRLADLIEDLGGGQLSGGQHGGRQLNGGPSSTQTTSDSNSQSTANSKTARRTLPSDDSVGSDEGTEFEVLPDLVPGDKSYLNDPKFLPLLNLVGVLCCERGLDSQNYQCKTCARPVGVFYGKARVCSFDGGYYCYECHENEMFHIPSKIIFNWDFRKFYVSRRNLDFLHLVQDEPLFDINKLNPSLYSHIAQLAVLQDLRTQLRYLKTYLFSCSQHVADELRRQVWPREYLFDNIHSYSLNDLLQVHSGNLMNTVRHIIQFATKHVYECRLCPLKGFICEICKNSKVIYPFEMDTTVRCAKCKSVYHKKCKTEMVTCPKCARYEARMTVTSPDELLPKDETSIHSAY